MAGSVPDNAITSAKIAAGAVGSSQLANNLTLPGTTTGTFSGSISGNATTATTAGSAVSFTGALGGDVTGSQGATVIAATTVTGKALTGFSSTTGMVTVSDTILTAINKLDGNLALKAPLASPTFTGTVTATTYVGDGSGLTNLPVNTTPINEPPINVAPVMDMVWIRPGTFLMGSRSDEPGRSSNETQHAVTLTQGFWMGVHEVTQREYLAVIGSNPSNFTGDTNRPVEQVSWNGAVAYCTALTNSERSAGRIPATWSYRLPTEAEWEYCCRAGARTTRFCYGGDISATALANYAWYSSNAASTTHPVEQKLANPWGLCDMHGNVFEWCLDSWDGVSAYGSGSVSNPLGTTGSQRVLRGGSWFHSSSTCRSAQRSSNSPGNTNVANGFRVVLAPVP